MQVPGFKQLGGVGRASRFGFMLSPQRHSGGGGKYYGMLDCGES